MEEDKKMAAADGLDVATLIFAAVMTAMANGMTDLSNLNLKMTEDGMTLNSAGVDYPVSTEELSSFEFLTPALSELLDLGSGDNESKMEDEGEKMEAGKPAENDPLKNQESLPKVLPNSSASATSEA
jgi:hypothetical protein